MDFHLDLLLLHSIPINFHHLLAEQIYPIYIKIFAYTAGGSKVMAFRSFFNLITAVCDVITKNVFRY